VARLGDALREQRERMGVTMLQAAEDTRIREKFLRAIESGDYQSLPGTVYTKGFLRNYAEYLNLDAEEMVALYTGERGGSEPLRSFSPMKPLVKRSFIFTPTVLGPVVVLAGVLLFVGYVYYQFTNFAVAPRVDITDPPGDAVSQTAEYIVKGKTNPEGRITVRTSPGLDTINDVHPAKDGTFSVTVPLKPGPNHVEVQVLDPSGKLAQASRTIQLNPVVSNDQQAPQLIIEQPANGGTYTNAPVTVSGRVDKSVASVTVNGAAAAVGTDGTFIVTVNFVAGPQTIHVAARTATGAEVQETRTVAVSYTAAVVTVRITGGDAWILATVDGTQANGTNTIFRNGGEPLTFIGKTVSVRSGNAGVTFLAFNGQDIGKMGEVGQVTERSFNAP
jgi:cytoskeletal protein RodZ